MSRVPVLLTALVLMLPGGSMGEGVPPGPTVVELFTSQGCSTCPPADELLLELAEHEDVLALSLHVDYWDYMGWEDDFADPAYTRRQKAYAHDLGERMIYTPQMIVQGTQRVVGNRPGDLLEAVGAHMGQAGPVALTARREGGTLHVEAHAEGALDGPLVVQLVRYAPRREVAVTAGENAGHRLSYANVVTLWDVLGEWDGRGPFEATVEIEGEDAAAVIVQRPGPGVILAAARAK